MKVIRSALCLLFASFLLATALSACTFATGSAPMPEADAPIGARPAAAPNQMATPALAMPTDQSPVATLPFTIELPLGWTSVVTNTKQAVETRRHSSIMTTSEHMDKRASLLVEGASAAILIASSGNGDGLPGDGVGLLALAAPAGDLRLPTIISATMASISGTPGVTVTAAALLPDLRANGEPVARIDYLARTPLSLTSGAQFIVHDITTRQLVVLTFSGSVEKMEEFVSQINEIVRSVSVSETP